MYHFHGDNDDFPVNVDVQSNPCCGRFSHCRHPKDFQVVLQRRPACRSCYDNAVKSHSKKSEGCTWPLRVIIYNPLCTTRHAKSSNGRWQPLQLGSVVETNPWGNFLYSLGVDWVLHKVASSHFHLGFQLLGVGVNAGELRIQIRMCSLYSCIYQSSNPWHAANRTNRMMIQPKLQRTLGKLKTSLAVMHLACSSCRNPNQLCNWHWNSQASQEQACFSWWHHSTCK